MVKIENFSAVLEIAFGLNALFFLFELVPRMEERIDRLKERYDEVYKRSGSHWKRGGISNRFRPFSYASVEAKIDEENYCNDVARIVGIPHLRQLFS